MKVMEDSEGLLCSYLTEILEGKSSQQERGRGGVGAHRSLFPAAVDWESTGPRGHKWSWVSRVGSWGRNRHAHRWLLGKNICPDSLTVPTNGWKSQTLQGAIPTWSNSHMSHKWMKVNIFKMLIILWQCKWNSENNLNIHQHENE